MTILSYLLYSLLNELLKLFKLELELADIILDVDRVLDGCVGTKNLRRVNDVWEERMVFLVKDVLEQIVLDEGRWEEEKVGWRKS